MWALRNLFINWIYFSRKNLTEHFPQRWTESLLQIVARYNITLQRIWKFPLILLHPQNIIDSMMIFSMTSNCLNIFREKLLDPLIASWSFHWIFLLVDSSSGASSPWTYGLRLLYSICSHWTVAIHLDNCKIPMTLRPYSWLDSLFTWEETMAWSWFTIFRSHIKTWPFWQWYVEI